MGILSKAAKEAAKARKAKRGSKRVKNMSQHMSEEMDKSKSTPTQRAFGGGRKQGLKKGRKQGAAVGAITVSSIAGMTLMEMRSRLKEEQRRADAAESAVERAQAEANAAKLQVAIEKAVAKANTSDSGAVESSLRPRARPSTSLRPRARPSDEEVDVSPRAERNERKEVGMAKGGKVKKYNKGGYANCGASMKPTQKSTNMAYGGIAKKKMMRGGMAKKKK